MPRLLSGGKRLNGLQIKQFRESLLDAFDLNRFDEMLLFQRSLPRERIALGNDLETIVLRVLERAEMESWTAELLHAARTTDPHNVALFSFAQQFGLAPQTAPLERKIREVNPAFDPLPWRKRLAELEPQICRVEVKIGASFAYGTGFLLGPDIVMTNYHIVERVIDKGVSPENVTLRFDYKALENGTSVNEGTVYRLMEDDWLVDYSPYSQLDLEMHSDGADPSPEELDYVLLRVAGEPGNAPVGGEAVKDPNIPLRGWVPLPTTEHTFEPQSSLFILQHPEGAPLKLALETQAVIGLNVNKTRVRYQTNTEPGSSGSPCFDADSNLIALHHLGDSNFSKPMYNQGIPFTAILDLLEKRGKKHPLG